LIIEDETVQPSRNGYSKPLPFAGVKVLKKFCKSKLQNIKLRSYGKNGVIGTKDTQNIISK
jgi:hypothetical protein